MIINKDIKTDKLQTVGSGAEACVLKYNRNTVIKDFREYWHWDKYGMCYLNNKLNKLMVLKEYNLPTMPKIYDFYCGIYYGLQVMYAYTMEYLKNNNISWLTGSYSSRLELVKLIIANTLKENEMGIYNFDISLRNIFITKDGTLKNFDIDNFHVLKYSTDLYSDLMEDFISTLEHKKLLLMQNLAFLVAIIKILFNIEYKDCHVSYMETSLTNKIADDVLLGKIVNIIEGKEEDINEVLALVKPNSIR